MIRATLPTIQNRLSDQTMQEFDLWLIKYGETTDYSGDIGIWQYTGAGSVAGVRGRIGRLRALRDYPSVIQKYSPGTNKKQAVPESSPSIKSPIIQAFDTLYSLSELRESIRVLFEDSDIKKLLSKEPSACKCEHKAESLSVEQTEDQNTDDLNENKHNEPATDEILTENNTFQNDPAQPSESSGFEVGPPQIELSQPDLSPTKPDTPQNKDNMDKTPIPPNEPSSDIEPDSSSEPLQCDECECQFEKLETDRDIMPDLLSLTPKSNVSNLISPNEFEDDEEETEELHNVRRPMRGRWKWLF